MNLNQNLIITYSNQKARELKKSLKNPLDKVVTLQSFVNEFSEKHSFKTLIEPIIATSFIYKTIKDENIEYLDFISLNSDTLDLIYDFILKTNASKVDVSEIIKDDKLKAIKLLSSKYSEFKNKNNLVDMNDVFQLAIDKFTQFITNNNINAIIASSFGAFIALHIPHSIYKFLINPCFYPSQEVPKLNKNLSANFINQCKTIENTQTPVDNESILFTFAFFSTHDQLFSYKNTYLEKGYTKTITLPNEPHTPTPKGLEIVANTINSQLLG